MTAAPPDAPPAPIGSDDVNEGGRARARRRMQRALPLVSLCTSIAGAVWMDRTPARAPLIVAAAAVGWLLSIAVSVLLPRVSAGARRREKAARFVALFANQVALQQALFFPLPFFVRASGLSSLADPASSVAPNAWSHLPFAAVYVVAVVVVLWDPLFAACAARAAILFTLQAFAAFVALVVTLPVLGIGNEASFVFAASAVAIGVPLLGAISDMRGRTGRSAAAFGLVLGVACFAAAPLVPPAPLAPGETHFALRVVQRAPEGVSSTFLLPDELVCHSAIRAPLGLRDQLFHVWLRDDVVVQRVALRVEGGREAGFRTWSRITRPPAGRWRCEVRTRLGQRVSSTEALVRAR